MSSHFEKLIRLEDEELNDSTFNQGHSHQSENESCKVPMIPNDGSHRDDEARLKQLKSTGCGVQFTIQGRHIHMNPNQLKYLSLITLTIQNAALNLTMRAARTQVEQFSISVAVTVAEIFKLITCVFLLWSEESNFNKAAATIKKNLLDNRVETLKVAVPSFVYYVQNNLLYMGSTHLDAATLQVTYQLKILTTAIFSVALLNKRLSRIQWISLFTLFTGVALIEIVTVKDHSKNSSSSDNRTSIHQEVHRLDRPIVGFVAVLIACCLSGFAGVYFEKILKDTSHVSLWIRNIQLSVVAIPLGLIQIIFFDKEVAHRGAFYGFSLLTWVCIILQVQGGLLVAVVVKFANNILKGFATSLAILISTVASIFFLSFNLTPSFLLGATLVIASVMMYNKQ